MQDKEAVSLKKILLWIVLVVATGLYGAAVAEENPSDPPSSKATGQVEQSGEENKDVESPASREAEATDSELQVVFKGKTYVIPERAPAGTTPERWGKLRKHIRSGGKWSLVLYYWNKTLCQTVVDFEGTKVENRSLASGPKGEVYLPLDKSPESPHGHLGLFATERRETRHWSKEYSCWMPWCLFYFEGHAIHQTSETKQLGRPASHGCTRNDGKAAKWRFNWVGKSTHFVWVVKDKELSEGFALQTHS